MNKSLTLYLLLILLMMQACKKDLEQPVGLSNMNRVVAWEQLMLNVEGGFSFSPRSNGSICYDEQNVYLIGTSNFSDGACSQIWKISPDQKKIAIQSQSTPEISSGGVSFLVDGYLFYGLGITNTGFSKNIYIRNESSQSWGNIDFPGAARSNAVSFVIGRKAYVGLGSDGVNYFNDFYEYDLSLSTWKKISDFGGLGRQDACAFVINGKACVGTGYNGGSYFKDFWDYNPASNTWTQMPDLPGSERDDAVAFALEKRAYVGTGWNQTKGIQSDFWEYNPYTGQWKSAADLLGSGRFGAVAFTHSGKAYVGTGNNSTDLNDFYVSK